MRPDNLPHPPLPRELLDQLFRRLPLRKPIPSRTGPRPASGEGIVVALRNIHHGKNSI